MITFIGDVHGKFDTYHARLVKIKHPTFQVGDMGLGFGGKPLVTPASRHQFIHGNHDNPNECLDYDNYLGRFGYDVTDAKLIFYLSGAYSIDRHHRIEGRDWWRDEELSYKEMSAAIRFYDGADIIVSHDCPAFMYSYLGIPSAEKKSLTANGLDTIYNHKNKPKLWVFGHHHKHLDETIDGTRFICLPELATFTI